MHAIIRCLRDPPIFVLSYKNKWDFKSTHLGIVEQWLEKWWGVFLFFVLFWKEVFKLGEIKDFQAERALHGTWHAMCNVWDIEIAKKSTGTKESAFCTIFNAPFSSQEDFDVDTDEAKWDHLICCWMHYRTSGLLMRKEDIANKCYPEFKILAWL